MSKKGTLVISLDFELHWGRFDKYHPEQYIHYYRNTREVIPAILELFSKHGIHATWATVGMLMADNKEEWEAFSPSIKPDYAEPKFSAYHWAKDFRKVPNEILFAPNLIKEILSTPGQELGSHTYSHYYTGEKGSTEEAFLDDLKAAKRIAKGKFGIDLKSLVFPRNQYDETILSIVEKAGFKTVRTNPSDWFWKNTAEETLIKKVFRTGDTLFSLGKQTCFDNPVVTENGLCCIPASRLLRPYRPGTFFNKLRVKRIKEELSFAAAKGLTYHLWWHPHNFGHFPKENMKVLEEILLFTQGLKDQRGLQSKTMDEFITEFLPISKSINS
ncbi:polysaccharide deacetylase family protein [Algoriphagus sp. CAU 1675]|uniref:polysaccharide deacetylase family protein n=1 Tax=Algoriphagus sp. CAU 1675 TaxID=3032597 RepID=UPI0023DB8CFC|nr:polysaccharide deacetylase family protein [Algoriphagus sp. CAU 1675]MDF2159369.1 polysaccharide deacetylase family protein [Algoriphagus sp. CAU 1675]